MAASRRWLSVLERHMSSSALGLLRVYVTDVKSLAFVLLFIALTADRFDQYGGLWWTPFRWLGEVFVDPSSVKVPLLTLFVVVLLAASSSNRAARALRGLPLLSAIYATLGAIALWCVWGLWHGGDSTAMTWQVYPWIAGLLMGLMLGNVLTTPEDFRTVGKLVIAAAVIRAILGLWFWSTGFQAVPLAERPNYVTSHGDTVLFVGALIVAASYVLEARRGFFMLVWLLPLMVAIMLANNRRLAWASLAMGLMPLYFLLPKRAKKSVAASAEGGSGLVKSRINRWLWILAPLLAGYVAVGTVAEGPVFAPVRAIMTMGDKKDSSTRARQIEDNNLINTARPQWIRGVGWGHSWIAYDHAGSVSDIYELYQFMPHNSTLAVLVFTGVIGFFCHWVEFPVLVFLAVLTYRRSKEPLVRAACSASLGITIAFMNQAFGDIGLQFQMPWFVMSCAIAATLRMAAIEGVWASSMYAGASAVGARNGVVAPAAPRATVVQVSP